MTFHKPFDPGLYNTFDSLARRRVVEMFQETVALEIREPEDKYDVDFNVYRRGVLIGHLELEVKTHWIGQFPFSDIQFLERKIKYERTLWVLFNRDCTQHLTVRIGDIKKCERRVLPNKYSAGQEETFYVVPIHLVTFGGLQKLIQIEERRLYENAS